MYVENVVEGGQRKRESEKEEKMKKMCNKIVLLYIQTLYTFFLNIENPFLHFTNNHQNMRCYF